MPVISRRALLTASSLVLLPRLTHAQRRVQSRPRFRVEIAEVRRTAVDASWHVHARVTLHNDSGRTLYVRTGCGSVFDAVGGRLGQHARHGGIDQRVQLCSPALPSPVPLRPGATAETRTYVFETPARYVPGIVFYVEAQLAGATYRSNQVSL